MRKRIFYSAFILFILISQCKKDNTSKGDDPSLFEVVNVADSAGIKFYEFAIQTDGNPYAALSLTKEWTLTMEAVEDAIITDSSYLRIRLKSGLLTSFHFDETDENGISKFRGSSGSANAKIDVYGNDGGCSHEIENKSVLIFAAAFTEFYGTSTFLEGIGEIYTNADEDYSVTILKDGQCTYDILETFGDYGLVIIDTHGEPDAFLLGYKITMATLPATEEEVRELIIAQAGEDVLELLLKGDIGYQSGGRINTGLPNWHLGNPQLTKKLWITSKYINSLGEWPETVILGNMCYSASNKVHKPEFYSSPLIRTAFTNRKLISYYGYSRDNDFSNVVSDQLCKDMEDSLSRAFVIDGDSTGIAHLKADDTEFNDINVDKTLKFKHFNANNYCFISCGKAITDSRDGKKYKTVCIGDQVWMAENLRYDVPASYCYNDSLEYCDIYGKLYNWNTVMNGSPSSNNNPSGVQGICPQGWHVPGLSEWDEMIEFLGGADVAGGHLKAVDDKWKSPNAGATNSSGFTALPAGSVGGQGPGFPIFFGNISEFAFFHTSVSPETGKFTYLRLSAASSGTISGPSTGVDYGGVSLRCVKD